jgi:hypothetical protein
VRFISSSWAELRGDYAPINAAGAWALHVARPGIAAYSSCGLDLAGDIAELEVDPLRCDSRTGHGVGRIGLGTGAA